jgi:hypothetical protein
MELIDILSISIMLTITGSWMFYERQLNKKIEREKKQKNGKK